VLGGVQTRNGRPASSLRAIGVTRNSGKINTVAEVLLSLNSRVHITTRGS